MEAWVRVRGRVDATYRAEVEVEPDPNPNPNPNPNATRIAEARSGIGFTTCYLLCVLTTCDLRLATCYLLLAIYYCFLLLIPRLLLTY